MIERKTKQSSPRSDKVRDPRIARKFLEELSWVLNSYSHLDFRALPELASRDFLAHQSPRRSVQQKGLGNYVSDNPNIHFLIGVLPEIFVNKQIFPSNDDLIEFANTALNLSISRSGKRSRYETIGMIVCETAKLNDDRLERLVRALTRLLSNDPNARQLVQNRPTNRMNWNEIIQKLTSDD